ncbi:hypothetical protein [Longimicrobium sp.]|uniref:hypothetical protein n=1 Tax=Longimicrobium sp. TaxID=2029185 RepID=UPI002BAC0619|nr:hypothetical protein [Longimicrobium sp.]HSU14250.1 hypothetical protein [Longimicrobium sp.]
MAALAPHVVRSLSMQLVFATLTLGFGILALRVAPRPGRNVRLGAWHLAGVTFTTIGAIATVVDVLAIPAAVQGSGRFFDFFLHASTIGNDARGFAVFGFALALTDMMVRRRPAPPRRVVIWGMVGLLAVGAGVGVLEGAFVGSRQHSVIALVSGATVVALFAALYAGMVSNSIDWHLWVALGIYAVREALASVISAARAAGYIANEWKPSAVWIFPLGMASVLVMLWCTLVRLGVARGTDAPGLLERLRG